MHKLRSLVIVSLTSLLTVAVTTSCKDHIDAPTLQEDYDRNFVKHFGVPASSHPWSEAVSQTFTVVTRQCLNVKLMATIDGHDVLFADLGNISGKTEFSTNIPKTTKNLFVRVNEAEDYTISVGQTLNLDQLRAASVVDNGALSVTLSDRKPEVSILGKSFNTRADETPTSPFLFEGYHPDHNLLNEVRYKAGDDWNIWTSVLQKTLNSPKTENGKRMEKSYVNVYPVMARKNQYDEDDYVVGVFFRVGDTGEIRHYDICGPGELNASPDNMWIEDADGTTVTVNSGEWFLDKNVINNLQNTKGGNFLRTKGVSIDVSGFTDADPDHQGLLGFYIKSGIDNFNDKISDNHCKYKHITYSSTRYNQPAWELDEQANRTACHYDVQLSNAGVSYVGGITHVSKMMRNSNLLSSVQSRLSKLEVNFQDEYDHAMQPRFGWYAFAFQPTGSASKECYFDDFVLIFETTGDSSQPRESFHNRDPKQSFPWLLAAEDLGGTDDWDFNDLIVSVADVTTNLTAQYTDVYGFHPAPLVMARQLTVTPLAAGATLPNYLMFEGKAASADIKPITTLSELDQQFTESAFFVGTEIHRWLREEDDTQMLNTTTAITHRGRSVTFNVPLNYDGADYQAPGATPYADNNTLAGFWILVDAQKQGEYHTQIPFDPQPEERETEFDKALTIFNGHIGAGGYSVNTPDKTGNVAPQMILCHRSWYWPKERVGIDEAWRLFPEWVKEPSTIWHSNQEDKNLGLYNAELIIHHSNDEFGWVYYYTPEAKPVK